ncbi:MAG: O-antigen ligase family protein [Alteromonadaceae bacterium]|nr:O-antigen ligase family protein [Alteromonadaceae bacterium]
MKIDHVTFKKFFLYLSFFYYLGFLNFITGMFGGGGDDVFATSAAGSIANQIVGTLLLLMSLLLLLKVKIVQISLFIKHFWLWGLLIFWFVLSTYWSYAPPVTFRRVIAFTTLVLTAYCLVQIFTPKSLLIALVVTVTLAATIGLIEAIISPQNAFISVGHRAGAFTGMYFDKNAGARLYANIILIIFGLELYKKRWGIIALSILTLCLLMSRSATSLVIVVTGCSLIFLFKYMQSRNTQQNLVRLITIAILLSIAAYVILALYEFILGLLGRDPDLTDRTIIWELMQRYIEAEFFKGYGFGAFWASDAVSEFINRWGFIGNAHSGYYEALLHGGIIALVLVISILIHSMWVFTKNYVNGDSPSITPVLVAIIIIQAIVNYIGFIIINHNADDMFLFLIAYFINLSIYSGLNSKKYDSFKAYSENRKNRGISHVT